MKSDRLRPQDLPRRATLDRITSSNAGLPPVASFNHIPESLPNLSTEVRSKVIDSTSAALKRKIREENLLRCSSRSLALRPVSQSRLCG